MDDKILVKDRFRRIVAVSESLVSVLESVEPNLLACGGAFDAKGSIIPK